MIFYYICQVQFNPLKYGFLVVTNMKSTTIIPRSYQNEMLSRNCIDLSLIMLVQCGLLILLQILIKSKENCLICTAMISIPSDNYKLVTLNTRGYQSPTSIYRLWNCFIIDIATTILFKKFTTKNSANLLIQLNLYVLYSAYR